MKWLVLVIALIAGSAGTSRAQVFKPRGKGPLLKKVELKTPDVKPDPKKPEVAPVAVKAAPVVAKAPAMKATPKKKKTAAKKKHKKGDDDDDVKVSDDDDDVKVSDD